MKATLERATGHEGAYPNPADFDVTEVRPAPPPPPRAARKVVPVPGVGVDLDTAERQLMADLFPDVVNRLTNRINRIRGEIDDLVEQARLHDEVTLKRFALAVVRHLKLIASLEAELIRHDPTFTPDPWDVIEETHRIIRSVRRFADGEALRGERARLEKKTVAELDEEQRGLDQLARGICPTTVAKEHRTSGLCEPEDEAKRQIGLRLTNRAERFALLTALGSQSTRSKAASVALEAAGHDVVLALSHRRGLSTTHAWGWKDASGA